MGWEEGLRGIFAYVGDRIQEHKDREFLLDMSDISISALGRAGTVGIEVDQSNGVLLPEPEDQPLTDNERTFFNFSSRLEMLRQTGVPMEEFVNRHILDIDGAFAKNSIRMLYKHWDTLYKTMGNLEERGLIGPESHPALYEFVEIGQARGYHPRAGEQRDDRNLQLEP